MEEELIDAQPEAQIEVEVPETEGQDVETQEQKEMYKLKHLKEEKEVSLDEMRTLAQKGMDYDRVKEKVEGLSNSKGSKYLNKLAEQYDMDVDGLIDKLEEMDKEQNVKTFADEYGLSDVEKAKKLYELEQQGKTLEKQKQSQLKQEQDDKELSKFTEFLKNEMNVDLETVDIDPEVWRLHEEENVSYMDAMLRVEFKKNKQQTKVKNHNENIEGASIGDIGNGSTVDLEGPINDEWLSKATQKEMGKRWKEVTKFLATKN